MAECLLEFTYQMRRKSKGFSRSKERFLKRNSQSLADALRFTICAYTSIDGYIAKPLNLREILKQVLGYN